MLFVHSFRCRCMCAARPPVVAFPADQLTIVWICRIPAETLRDLLVDVPAIVFPAVALTRRPDLPAAALAFAAGASPDFDHAFATRLPVLALGLLLNDRALRRFWQQSHRGHV